MKNREKHTDVSALLLVALSMQLKQGVMQTAEAGDIASVGQIVITSLLIHSREGGSCHVRSNEMGADYTLESMERT